MIVPVAPEQVLKLVDMAGHPAVGALGAALEMTNPSPNGMSGLTAATRSLIAAAKQAPPPPAKQVYRHPRTEISRLSKNWVDGKPVERGPLTPAEVLWLERLPQDPAKLPFADAVRLLELDVSATDPTDRPLLDSIVRPVREYHDLQNARVAKFNADLPLPDAPAETLPALADAIASANPSMHAADVLERASSLLSEHLARRTQERSVAAARAQQTIDDLQAKVDQRQAVHRGFVAPAPPSDDIGVSA